MSNATRWRSRADNSMLAPLLMAPMRLLYPVLRRAQVDIPRCEAIIRNQLMLDQFGGKRGSTSVSGIYVMMMAGYWLIGMMLAIPTAFIALGKIDAPPALWLGAYQTVALPLLGFPLAMKYSELFIDATDIHIVAPTPVNNATLFAARLLHAAFYTGVLSVCFGFGPMIAGLFAYPWYAVLVIYPLATLLTVVFVVSGVGLIYSTALRVFGPRRFERAALWIQVVLASLAMGGGNIVMHSPFVRDAVEALINNPAHLIWIPTTHSGALLELASGFEITSVRLTMAVLAFAIPAIMVALAIRLAARQFLAGLLGHEVAENTRTGWPQKNPGVLSRFMATRTERAAAPVARAMIQRDAVSVRAFWPQVIGLALMTIVIPISTFAGLDTLDVDAKWFALILFFPAIMDVSAVDMLRLTKDDGAAWIYLGTSVDERPELLRGAVKSLFLSTLIPLKVALLVALTLTIDTSVIIPGILATVVSTTIALHLVHILTAHLPFTLTPASSMNQGLGNIGGYFTALFALAVGTLVCAGLMLHDLAAIAGILICLPFARGSYRRLGQLTCEPLSFDDDAGTPSRALNGPRTVDPLTGAERG